MYFDLVLVYDNYHVPGALSGMGACGDGVCAPGPSGRINLQGWRIHVALQEKKPLPSGGLANTCCFARNNCLLYRHGSDTLVKYF